MRIGISDSVIPTRAVEALGATAVPLVGGGPVDALDAAEGHMGALVGNHYLAELPYVTANLPGVGAADHRVHERLAVRRAVGRAAVVAARGGQDGDARQDPGPGQRRCRGDGSRVSHRRQAGDGIGGRPCCPRVRLEARGNGASRRPADGQGARGDRPAQVARAGRPGVRGRGVGDPSPGQAHTPIDGGWSSCPTVDEIVAAGGDAGEARGNAGCVTLTFNGGVFTESGASAADSRPGSYALEGDQLTIQRADGERFVFTVSFFRDALVLSRPKDPKGVSPAPWRALPFSRAGG